MDGRNIRDPEFNFRQLRAFSPLRSRALHSFPRLTKAPNNQRIERGNYQESKKSCPLRLL